MELHYGLDMRLHMDIPDTVFLCFGREPLTTVSTNSLMSCLTVQEHQTCSEQVQIVLHVCVFPSLGPTFIFSTQSNPLFGPEVTAVMELTTEALP